MEIIQSLEPFSRGAYAGAVGYIGLDGVLDTCIAIRTVFAQGNILKIQAGAGIVADSDPGREYDETVSKARAVQEAVRLATMGLSSPLSQWTEERKGA
jgi:anthranilate synthase component 1